MKNRKDIKTMKLFILWSIKKSKIVAISESRKDMRIFYLQNGYTKRDHIIKIVESEKFINKILVKHDDLYLIDYYNFIIREKDKRPLDEILYMNIQLIESTLDNLKYINQECILKPKHHNLISNVISILKSKKKKDNIIKFINIANIISDYYNNHRFRNIVNECMHNF